MATLSPYTHPGPIRCKCMANRTTCKAVTFTTDGTEITISSLKVRSTSALSDGKIVYLCSNNNDTPELGGGLQIFLKISQSARNMAARIYILAEHPANSGQHHLLLQKIMRKLQKRPCVHNSSWSQERKHTSFPRKTI